MPQSDSSVLAEDHQVTDVNPIVSDAKNGSEEPFCKICLEHPQVGNQLIRMSCNEHWVCVGCATRAIQTKVDGQYEYPPRVCCGYGDIDPADHPQLFSKELVAEYNLRSIEFATFADDRRYCGNISCMAFLDPDTYCMREEYFVSLFRYATCPMEACQSMTCVECKQTLDASQLATHVGKCNPEDKPDIPLGDEMKSCPSCHYIVAIPLECFRAQCLNCHENFCWKCLKIWTGPHGCPTWQAEPDRGWDI
ncbi:hypothetical protein BU16DRAFT_599214 [Lophium mytilinum]|uniref:RING-type domain-containing protein n=1 Tax=Lophium mytilinum TaxID=390894 RepID=A0A6A6RC49_9PEZI|nr:hypothetical protein BU16DRAFT_599214 [Lophium mytilinum]